MFQLNLVQKGTSKSCIASTMKRQYEQEQRVRKPLVICLNQIITGILLKMLKCFEAMLNIFELYKKLVKNKES